MRSISLVTGLSFAAAARAQQDVTSSISSTSLWFGLTAIVVIAVVVVVMRRKTEASDRRKDAVFEAHQARERAREEFDEELKDAVSRASADDMSFVVLRRLLARIKKMQPQRMCAAMVKFPDADGDRLVCPDPRMQNEVESIIRGHEQALKNVSWTGNPVTLHLRAEAGQWMAQTLVVLPIPIPKPGHGILLMSREPGQSFHPDDIELAQDFAQRTIDSMELAKHEAQEKSDREIDALTGIFNRQALELRAAHGFNDAIKNRQNFSALWIEIDKFRVFAKEQGQEKADAVLKTVAQRISRAVDRQHIAGRWDGHEFVVLMPAFPEFQALKLAESLVSVIAREIVYHGENLSITASIGLAAKYPSDAHFTKVLERATKGKDQAKYQGGNCARKGSDESAGINVRNF
jgi:diguanylate cyclase (GGDEF)-like protein